jgi:hypothetical protein
MGFTTLNFDRMELSFGATVDVGCCYNDTKAKLKKNGTASI